MASPSGVPITSDSANPSTPRLRLVQIASPRGRPATAPQNVSPHLGRRRQRVRRLDLRQVDELPHADQERPGTRAAAAPRDEEPARPRLRRQLRPGSRARRDRPRPTGPRGASGPSASVRSAPCRSLAMAADLLAQLAGDLAGQRADRGRLDRAGLRDVDLPLADDPARAGTTCRTTRWPSRTASRTLCVTKTTDSFCSAQTRVSSSCSTSRVMASSAANGSSISSTELSWASARASATRWRMPPESSCTRLSHLALEADQREQPLGLRRAARARPTPRSRSASSTFWPAVSHGNSAGSWNIRAGPLAGTSMVPAVGSVETGDQVEQRRLAAARGAEQADELARLDGQADVVEDGRAAAARTTCETRLDADCGARRRGRPRAPPAAPEPSVVTGRRTHVVLSLSGTVTPAPRPPAETGSWPSASSTLLSRRRS